jgi:hypothetical protein
VSTPKVNSYKFGEMVVDGKTHTNDLILLPDRVISDWWREQGHSLSAKDLEDVLDAEPEILVVGTGARGVMSVPAETRQAIEEAGIELRIAETDKAWQTYNDLQSQRETAGAFHLTC